jgi:hypothetical protein
MKEKKIPKKQAKVVESPVGFVDRSLIGVSPLKEQFEPTDATPLRQHHRMAGMT